MRFRMLVEISFDVRSLFSGITINREKATRWYLLTSFSRSSPEEGNSLTDLRTNYLEVRSVVTYIVRCKLNDRVA